MKKHLWRAAAAGALALVAFPAMACVTIAPQAMAQGVQFVLSGKSKEAIEQFNKGLADGYNNRGEAHQIAGEWGAALADFNTATQLNPTDSRPYQGRAGYYMQEGRFDEALKEFDKSVAANDQFSWWALPPRAWVHSVKGENEKAVQDYDTLVRLAPREPLYLAQRGFAYYENGEPEKAMADFDKALSMQPRIPFAYLGRGLVYESKGNAYRAQQELAKLRQMDMGLAKQYAAKAAKLKSFGLGKKAKQYLDYAFKIDPALEKQYY